MDEFEGMMKTDLINAVIKPDHSLWLWGVNVTGLLGNGTLIDNFTPTRSTLDKMTVISLYGGVAFGADLNGNIWCWGQATWRLNPQNPVPPVTTPTKVAKLDGVIDIIIKPDILLLKNDGTLWELNWNWEEPTDWIQPNKLPFSNVSAVTEGMILTSRGDIKPVNPSYGQQPQFGGLVSEYENVKHIAHVYNRRSVILKADSTVWAWGVGNLGENGDGTYLTQESPVKVLNLENIIEISATSSYSLALRNDGTVWYWGYSGVENGENTGIAVPVQVEIDNVASICAGPICMVKKYDGSYWVFSFLNSNDRTPFCILK
jgi:alpha-tubulin suppressor-like RCC1 family protein